VNGLEDKGEGALQLLQDSFDQCNERNAFVGLRVPDVFREDSDSFGISVRLELVPASLENLPEGNGVGNNTVVDDDEFIAGTSANGVTVDCRGRSVGGPTCVGNGDLRCEDLGSIDV
jgi:hypothetical protein